MPYNSVDDAPSTLPVSAKKIWIAAYNSAWKDAKGSAKAEKEKTAAKIAWAAVKKQFTKDGDKWVRKQSLLLIPMPVVKLSKSGNRMRFLSTVVTSTVNTRTQRLDESLFYDFITNFNQAEPPALDLSHLSSLLTDPADAALANLSRLGLVDRLFIDGNDFKSGGYLHDTPIAAALFQNAKKQEGAVRFQTSAGFVPDMGNLRMIDDVLTYYGGRGLGYLDHEAVTAYPVDERTEIHFFDDADSEQPQLYADLPTLADDFRRLFGDTMPAELHPLIERLGLEDNLLVKQGAKMFLQAAIALPKITSPADDAIIDEDEWLFPADWPAQEKLAQYTALPPAVVVQNALDKTPKVEAAVLRKFQRNRARQSGISVKQSTNLLAPGGKGDETLWADPTNYKLPLWDARETAVTALEWGKPEQRVQYTTREQALITQRVQAALTTYCGMDWASPAYVAEPEPAFGNAYTIADAIDYQKAEQSAYSVGDLQYTMERVIDNIQDDESLTSTEKAAAIREVVSEFGTMVGGLVTQAQTVPTIKPDVTGSVKPPATAEARPDTAAQHPASRVAYTFAESVVRLTQTAQPAETLYDEMGVLITSMAQEMQSVIAAKREDAQANIPEWAQELAQSVATLTREVRSIKQGAAMAPVPAAPAPAPEVVRGSEHAAAGNIVAALEAKAVRRGMTVKPSAVITQTRSAGPAKNFAEVVERLGSVGDPVP